MFLKKKKGTQQSLNNGIIFNTVKPSRLISSLSHFILATGIKKKRNKKKQNTTFELYILDNTFYK